jgi:hypothetical protein
MTADAATRIERWLPVKGFEGLYEVSDIGRVRGVDRILPYERRDQYSGRMLHIERKRRGQLLRPGRKPDGHVTVSLGRGQSKDVHVLVLEAFVGPCPAGHESLHGNDVPDDNRLINLRWGTRSDNLHDAVRNGCKPVGERHSSAKITAADVLMIRQQAEAGWGSMARLARQFQVSESTIRQIRDRKSWRHVV